MFITEPAPHEEAAALISDKPVVSRRVFDDLLPEFQARAFVVSGVECASTLQRVRDLAAKLPAGGDWDELKAGILDEISPWLITSTDPEERQKQERAAVRRAELILRHNGWQAYAVTNYREMEEQKDVFPFRQYLSSEDSRVRASHAVLNKKIFPADHPFWNTHTPPWEFGCRCDVVPMLADEVDEIRGDEVKKAPEDRRVIEGAMLEEVERGYFVTGPTGKIDIRTPREKTGKGYEFRPDTLALSYEDVLSRYDAPVAQAFRGWAEGTKLPDGRTVAESFGGRPAGPALASGAAPAKPTAGAPARVSPVSAALDLKLSKKKEVAHALRVIDELHDDGQLPQIPVTGQPGGSSLGHYRFRSLTGEAVEIAIKASAPHPALTAAHEVGHFLDHQGMGAHGHFQSMIPGSRVAKIVGQLQATPTYARIARETSGFKSIKYYQDARELWARAYAQYVAEESGDAVLMEQLDAIRSGYAGWRQWPAEEFAAIRLAIRELFADLGWNPHTPNP